MSATLTRDELLVSVLPLQPGDVLLVKIPHHTTVEQVDKLSSVLREKLPDANPILFVTESMNVGIWRPVEPISAP